MTLLNVVQHQSCCITPVCHMTLYTKTQEICLLTVGRHLVVVIIIVRPTSHVVRPTSYVPRRPSHVVESRVE